MRTLFISIAFVSSMMAVAEPVAIVSAKSPITSASEEEVANVFLGKTSSLKGTGVTPVNLKDGSATRDAFLSHFTHKDAEQFKSYWAKLVFTGRAPQVQEFDSEAGLKAAVASDPSKIGMIDSSNVDGSVRVVAK